MPSQIKSLIIIITSGIFFGCAGPRFYSQAILGHAEVFHNTQSISTLDMNTLTKTEQHKINLAVQARQFAEEKLHLPSNGSFQSYARLEREFIVWNVFASQPFSLVTKKTCFLVVGCVPYLGFFSKTDAENYARKLESDGFDVYVAGIGAYSTLGWFNDPLLSTVIKRTDESLAELIFHELAHQKIYIKNDSEFNESFATAISQEGLKRWLKFTNVRTEKNGDEQQKEEQLSKIIIDVKLKLQSLYSSDQSLEKKEDLKKKYFKSLEANYNALKTSWKTPSPYDAFMYETWNNAKIMSFGAYHELVPKFKHLIESYGGNLPRVYGAVEEVKDVSKKQRRKMLFSTTASNGSPPAETINCGSAKKICVEGLPN